MGRTWVLELTWGTSGGKYRPYPGQHHTWQANLLNYTWQASTLWTLLSVGLSYTEAALKFEAVQDLLANICH